MICVDDHLVLYFCFFKPNGWSYISSCTFARSTLYQDTLLDPSCLRQIEWKYKETLKHTKYRFQTLRPVHESELLPLLWKYLISLPIAREVLNGIQATQKQKDVTTRGASPGPFKLTSSQKMKLQIYHAKLSHKNMEMDVETCIFIMGLFPMCAYYVYMLSDFFPIF